MNINYEVIRKTIHFRKQTYCFGTFLSVDSCALGMTVSPVLPLVITHF